MAEFGDALSTAIISQSDTKPSMFEVLAQENLRSAIRPAVGHVIKVISFSIVDTIFYSICGFLV